MDAAYSAAADHFRTWTHYALCQVAFAANCALEGGGYVEINGHDVLFDMTVVSKVFFDPGCMRYYAMDRLKTPLGYEFKSGHAFASQH